MHPMRANGLVFNTRDVGPRDAPVLVLSHALGTDLRLWDRVLPALAANRRVICYDLRGHGLSEVAPPPYAAADLIDDLVGLIDGFGLDRVALAGLSVGGFIALGATARLGARVTALAACDTGARIGDVETWQQRIDTVAGHGIAPLADATMARWFPESFRHDRPDETALWRAMVTGTPRDGYTGICHALRDGDLTGAAATVAVPTLVMTGSEDGSTPPTLGRATAALIPGAHYHEIAGAGHLPVIDKPGAFLGALLPFLEAHGA